MLNVKSRSIRTVLRWQALVTLAGALPAAWIAGSHGALSAALGGAVTMAASLVFAAVAGLGGAAPGTASGVVVRALRAEAAKVAAIVVLLWIVFATYEALVAGAFIATFVVTVVISSMAFFVRDWSGRNGTRNGRGT